MLVPVYAEADSKWIFNSWNPFFIPKPFSRVIIRYGDMLPPLSPEHSSQAFEDQRKALERLIQPALGK